MKKNTLVILSLILLCSCGDNVTKKSTLSSNQLLSRGEWLDSSDTINGISVRENKIAFFEKMGFDAEQIKEYFIVDSVYVSGEVETKKGEYLFVKNLPDTLKFKIVKRDKKAISLIDMNGVQKTYNFWR